MPQSETYTVKTRAEYPIPGGARRERHTYRGQTSEQVAWHRDYMKTNAPVGSTRSCKAYREN